eukprot:TRINITY_DN2625_c2_g1_i1.p1 TRINITY_DN2625_c2_g1~~TRINITY_DN2625_c2_g1_i1.p1  ORF type:complete len:129 (-),score=14.76 TRINITY_DN2625_c2_g1_i1:762-1148(-)
MSSPTIEYDPGSNSDSGETEPSRGRTRSISEDLSIQDVIGDCMRDYDIPVLLKTTQIRHVSKGTKRKIRSRSRDSRKKHVDHVIELQIISRLYQYFYGEDVSLNLGRVPFLVPFYLTNMVEILLTSIL